MIWRWLTAILLVPLALLLVAWLTRAEIAARIARAYFHDHGISSSVEIGALGLSGASGRFALGPAAAPDIAADRIELHFDPLSWTPRVVEVRLVNPVVRARMDAAGHVTLVTLQDWLDSLAKEQGHSRFVSDDLAISLTGLRALLATPGGNIEVDGDAKLVRGLPILAALQARPADLAFRGQTLKLRAAQANFDSAAHHLTVHFSGSLQNSALAAQDVEAKLDAGGFSWALTQGRLSLSAAQAHLQVRAAALTAGMMLGAPTLEATASRASLSFLNGDVQGQADFSATAQGATHLPVLRTPDPALTRAIAQNLSHLRLALAAHVARQGGQTRLTLSAPMTLTGAKGATLRVSALQLAGGPAQVTGRLAAELRGAGLPAIKFSLRNIAAGSGSFAGDAALSARFDLAMLRGADVTAAGRLSWRNGRLAFALSSCLKSALAAFHPGANLPEVGDLARDIHARVCALPTQPLLAIDNRGWRFAGIAQDASAFLPLANAQIDHAAAGLSFQGTGGDFSGRASVTAMQASDRAMPLRFQPVAGNGVADLQDGVWHGRFAVTGGAKSYPLGDIAFTHTLATGTGTAHIVAPIAFAQNKLQPEQLSPLLAALRRADGHVDFDGDISWTPSEFKSHGQLAINTLDFLTPLGRAHAVKSSIALVSLLPPATADNQQVTISQIDWTLPLSGVEVHFGFDPGTARIAAFSTGIAQGHAALGALTINLADPGHLQGEIKLTSIALGSLVAASNFGDKLKLEGKISGQVPFTLTPEGFRIADGHVAADGPGRLSFDRSLWTQGGPAANAVQDFAYQALENLAFDQMTADLNSVAKGRLQIVFHIKGRSDPPKPQTADIPIADLINGKALQETIPLPSGTPIDLTLDTSLNFDELLKSYAEAWSKSFSPAGPPDTSGATP